MKAKFLSFFILAFFTLCLSDVVLKASDVLEDGLAEVDHLRLTPPQWGTLSQIQQHQLESGDQLLVTHKIAGFPWPLFQVYGLVEASPEEVAATFWDVKSSPDYIPNCLSVQILAEPHPGVLETRYTLKMPLLLADDVAHVNNALSLLPSGGYRIAWEIEKAHYSKLGRGSLVILAYPSQDAHPQKSSGPNTDNKKSPASSKASSKPLMSLLIYSNFVNPGGEFATILLKPAENRIRNTVSAIVRQVEYEKKVAPQKLTAQVESLKKTVAQLHLRDQLKHPGESHLKANAALSSQEPALREK